MPDFDTLSVGDELPARAFPISRQDLVRYAGASGDFNPIHWNEKFATAVGLPGVIAHGMFTMATAGRLVSDWAGDPGAVIEYGTRFTSMVPVPDTGPNEGTTLDVSGKITDKDDAARTVTVELTATHEGTKVLGKARAVVRLP